MTNETGAKAQRFKAHLILVERVGKRRRVFVVMLPTVESAMDAMRATYPKAEINYVGGLGRGLVRKLKLKRNEVRRV